MAEPVFEQYVGLPAPALRDCVGTYAGYRMAGYEPGLHPGLPSRSLTFIVSFDQPVDLTAMPGSDQPPEAFFSLVGGLHDHAVAIRHDGHQHGIQLDLTPVGARRRFGMPAAELASRVVSLPDLLGSLGRELVDRLSATLDWKARFAILDDVLVRALHDADPAQPEVAYAWDRLVGSDGAVAVGAIAKEVGWSRRHLGERFRGEFGLSPKVMGRIVRFERANELLTTGPATLAEVAAVCGFTDQSHMTREWQALVGQSPGAWLEEVPLPSVQDDLTPAPAG